jgi:hypothetical protein
MSVTLSARAKKKWLALAAIGGANPARSDSATAHLSPYQSIFITALASSYN